MRFAVKKISIINNNVYITETEQVLYSIDTWAPAGIFVGGSEP